MPVTMGVTTVEAMPAAAITADAATTVAATMAAVVTTAGAITVASGSVGADMAIPTPAITATDTRTPIPTITMATATQPITDTAMDIRLSRSVLGLAAGAISVIAAKFFVPLSCGNQAGCFEQPA